MNSNLLEDWKTYSFAEVFDFSSGLSKSRDEFGFGFPFLSFKDVFYNYYIDTTPSELANTSEKEREKCSVKRGDIFVTRTSENADELGMSCVALSDFPNATFNGFTKRLRKSNEAVKLLPEYLAFYFRSRGFRNQVAAFVTMTTRASLNNEILGRLNIEVPPMEYQKKAATLLFSLDKYLRKISELHLKLDETLQSYFKEYLIKTDLGDAELQEGWEKSIISDIADVIGGGTPSTKKSEYYCDPPEGTPWLSPKDLSGYKWKYISHGARSITDLGLSKSSAKLMPAGSVLISSRAPIGYIAIAENSISTNQGFKSLVPKERVNTSFLYYWAKTNIKKMEAVASGSTFKEISGTSMKNLEIILPPTSRLKEFESFAKPFNDYQCKLRHKYKKVSEMRDMLIPKLMEGQIDISKIDILEDLETL